MVRLIVGMCINVASHKFSLKDVKLAMDQQQRLARSYSVPAHGLYLTKVDYPYI